MNEARRRAGLVSGLRGLARTNGRTPPPTTTATDEACDPHREEPVATHAKPEGPLGVQEVLPLQRLFTLGQNHSHQFPRPGQFRFGADPTLLVLHHRVSDAGAEWPNPRDLDGSQAGLVSQTFSTSPLFADPVR